jgi:taurine dioxygenase
MASIKHVPLSDEIPFGSLVTGLSLAALRDEETREQLRSIFEARGVVVFRQLDMSDELHLALAELFGPLQNYALPVSQRELSLEEDRASKAQLLDLEIDSLSEVDGRQVAGVLPWHFDSAYVGNINRGAVLRPVTIPPVGGETGFADGIQLYRDISPDLRARFEDLQILYYSKLMFTHQRFGFPRGLRYIRLSDVQEESIRKCEGARRAVHPAIWQRESGERVLHISPFQAAGIYGREDPEGDALLEEMCQEIYAKMIPYWHKWEMTDLVLWDNWRCLHGVNGYDPACRRHVQRYTIEGDYGFGFLEPESGERETEPTE